MVVRWLVPLSVLALLVAGCGGSSNEEQTTTASADTKPISGNWTGTLHQEGLRPFRIAVSINPGGRGAVAYTGIECGGIWTETGANPPESYSFREEIKFGSGGRCKGSGTVHLRLDGEQLDYAFDGGGVTSHGSLHRTDAAGLKPIFDEAGVTLL
jgi:hypothetical protein